MEALGIPINLEWLLLLPIPIFYKLTDVYRFKWENSKRVNIYRDTEKYSLIWHFWSACLNLSNFAIIFYFLKFTAWDYLPLILVIARFIYDLAWNMMNGCYWSYPGDGKGSMLERVDSFIANITGIDRLDVHWGLKVISLVISLFICYI